MDGGEKSKEKKISDWKGMKRKEGRIEDPKVDSMNLEHPSRSRKGDTYVPNRNRSMRTSIVNDFPFRRRGCLCFDDVESMLRG